MNTQQEILDMIATEALEPDLAAENARLRTELERVTAAAEEMREALGLGSPWPLIDVLRELANWCQHCGLVHNCDCHGHELRSAAIREARVMADRISKAISTDAGQGYVRKEDVAVIADVLVQVLAYFNRFQIHGPLRNRIEAAVDRAKEKGFA